MSLTLRAMEELSKLPEWLHRQKFATTVNGKLQGDSSGLKAAGIPFAADRKGADPVDALLICAEQDGPVPTYRLLLDLDVPVHVEKSTNGNTHLYVDVPMTREQHDIVLGALAKAGVIEEGYAEVGITGAFGATLRPPWVKKGEDKTLRQKHEESA